MTTIYKGPKGAVGWGVGIYQNRCKYLGTTKYY